jgi:NAD(P)H dehydrogenase (quinone)
MNRTSLLTLVLTSFVGASAGNTAWGRALHAALPPLFSMALTAAMLMRAAKAGVWVAYQIIGQMYGIEVLAGLSVTVALELAAAGAGWMAGRILLASAARLAAYIADRGVPVRVRGGQTDCAAVSAPAGCTLHALPDKSRSRSDKRSMHALIVYAHHDPSSFNGAMLSTAVETLLSSGWTVQVSDLYAETFRADAGPADFTRPTRSPRFGYVHEQRNAQRDGSYSPDILREQGRVREANLVIFQFPVWWYGPPAIVKGWADRVLSHGFAYTDTELFSSGLLKGKSAMVSVTTGGTKEELDSAASITGTLGEFMRPFTGGVLEFVGMTVHPTFAAFAPASAPLQARQQMLSDYKTHLDRELRAIAAEPRIP